MDLQNIDRDFGASLRIIRAERDMSQEDLAAAVAALGYQLSQATIGKIERGERKVTFGEAEALASALGTTTATFRLGPSYVTRDILESRLRGVRAELRAAMRTFESAQQLVAIEAVQLDEYDQDWLRDLVLESLEDVVDEHRKDAVSDNEARRRRDEMDGPLGARSATRGLLGEYEAKFGDSAGSIPDARAWEVIIRRQPSGADG